MILFNSIFSGNGLLNSNVHLQTHPFPPLFLDEILMIRGQLARPCFVMAWCLTTASGEWRLDGPQWCSGDCHASGGTAGPWYGRWPRSIATDVRKRCQRGEEMGAAVCNWKPLRSFERSSLVRDLDCFGGISTSRPAPAVCHENV